MIIFKYFAFFFAELDKKRVFGHKSSQNIMKLIFFFTSSSERAPYNSTGCSPVVTIIRPTSPHLSKYLFCL